MFLFTVSSAVLFLNAADFTSNDPDYCSSKAKQRTHFGGVLDRSTFKCDRCDEQRNGKADRSDTPNYDKIDDTHTFWHTQAKWNCREPTEGENAKWFTDDQASKDQPCGISHSAKLNASVQQAEEEQDDFNRCFPCVFDLVPPVGPLLFCITENTKCAVSMRDCCDNWQQAQSWV